MNLAQKNIDELYNSLMKRTEKTTDLQNVTDVLLKVYETLPESKNPESLLSKLVNYIYIVGFNVLHLTKEEESLLISLGDMSKRSGLNGRYSANFTDKSEFYSYFDKIKMPRR